MGATVRGFCGPHGIFAKIGVENIGSDLATFIRTVVVLLSFLVLLLATGRFATSGPISPRTWTFLILSGLGTGASWLCYFRALKLEAATSVHGTFETCRPGLMMSVSRGRPEVSG